MGNVQYAVRYNIHDGYLVLGENDYPGRKLCRLVVSEYAEKVKRYSFLNLWD